MDIESKCIISGEIVNEGICIHYEVFGEGNEKIMLIMGLASSGRLWYPNVSNLNKIAFLKF